MRETGNERMEREKDVVIEKTLDVIMEKNSLEEKTSLSTQVGVSGPTG